MNQGHNEAQLKEQRGSFSFVSLSWNGSQGRNGSVPSTWDDGAVHVFKWHESARGRQSIETKVHVPSFLLPVIVNSGKYHQTV